MLREGSQSSIINGAKVVSERLKFLNGLEAILFDKAPKQRFDKGVALNHLHERYSSYLEGVIEPIDLK